MQNQIVDHLEHVHRLIQLFLNSFKYFRNMYKGFYYSR
ncbi:hypothetical protein SS7213T_02903, partial [Staphylococcus simiae CCM 7213 = CCUG 51256]